ncbi:MAG: phosphoenolpyruvate carboxykinase (ATP) [Flavobacteriaceae bacterium]|nr:MAG: phosphoenolpyruvate carboxykinase (ATP) [Flavobacteriaceae bacterium]
MGKLEQYGILQAKENWQLSPDQLIKISVEKEDGVISSQGALSINTGEFTGRSPKDRFIVQDAITKDVVWWDGSVNIPFDSQKFDALYDKVTAHLSGKELYVRDGFACSDPRHRVKIRTVTEFAWSSLFAYNMFIRPTASELENFGQTDWLILNAPTFMADSSVDGTRQHNFSILNFTRKIALIGGSGYTGEMKKGIFSALNLTLPTFENTLPMHCSANVGEKGDTAMFFGLSGTGKTTLSADPNRKLIGDDEHGWTQDNTIFNFEGGCYAKVIDISAEKEPDIFAAIKHGALLENVVFEKDSNNVDYTDESITQNTRVSYPIDFIQNIQEGSLGINPTNIFFLTYDAFGVLPPISKLKPNQAAYHFISGYTSKVAGTEAGVTEPQTTFSACYGAAFMPLHPGKYAKMLSEKISATGVNVWLVNTGLNGRGERMSLSNTRALITAALEGKLNEVEFETSKFFGVAIPTSCQGIPSELLMPSNSWESQEAFKEKATQLANAFKNNFKKFEANTDPEIIAGGPII